MTPFTRAMLLTLIPGFFTFGLILLLGGPLWAAVGFGGVVAELRQSRVLANPPPDRSAALLAMTLRAIKKETA